MLRLTQWLPPPLHRLGLRLAHGIRIRWWRIRRPLLVGCHVIAVNPQGEVLLVRHSYGDQVWMLPGGGVKRGETPIAAAIRELAEETDCKLTGAVEVAVDRRVFHGATNDVHVIAGRTADTPGPDGREIIAAQTFAPGDLPRDIGPRLAENLPRWLAALPSE